MAKTQEKDAKKASKDMAKKVKGKVHLALLLDETGSMNGNQEAVVTGANEFIHSFREKDARIWLGMFDQHPGAPMVRVKIKGEKPENVVDLAIEDYRPRGMTPLNDAIIKTIEAMDKAVKKDERAMIVILTDGIENASEHGAEDVAKIIKKREKAGWAFLYLGADHNAEVAAAEIGLKRQGQAFLFTSSKRGTTGALRAATASAGEYVVSASAAEHLDKSAALHARTGGKIEEADEDE